MSWKYVKDYATVKTQALSVHPQNSILKGKMLKHILNVLLNN